MKNRLLVPCRRLACLGILSVLPAAFAWAGALNVTVVDEQGRPLPQAVVFLESPDAGRAVKPMSGEEIAQKDKAFQPGVLVVTRGTLVSFPNQDTVRHHVYSFSPAKRFELKLYTGRPANPVLFDQSGVVVLGCNIHDQMVAWLVVVDTPYHATTAIDGTAAIKEVPPGNYRLHAWHSRLPVGAATWQQPRQIGANAASVTVTLTGVAAQ